PEEISQLRTAFLLMKILSPFVLFALLLVLPVSHAILAGNQAVALTALCEFFNLPGVSNCSNVTLACEGNYNVLVEEIDNPWGISCKVGEGTDNIVTLYAQSTLVTIRKLNGV